ncbi:AF4/FMR2 family member 1-like [Lytechinus variegatus]|uniref:AF4/FMR2 family member 1-like n=1 Tax=Lytechinus variegatus TaxID=7654 RepID=UPI001BB15B76|nr:AF4/FMR2 family member 1-like [Lytechinus variegatus]
MNLFTFQPQPGQSSKQPTPGQSSQQPEPGQSSQQPQSGQSSQQPQHGSSSQQPQPGQSSQQHQPGQSPQHLEPGQSSQEPQFGQSYQQPQPGQSPKRLQPGQSSQQPQPGQSSQQPQPGQSSQQPQPGQSSQQPQPGQSSQQPQPGQSSQQPQPGQSSQQPQPGQSSEQPQHGSSSQQPQRGQSSKQPTPGQSSQQPEPGQSSQQPQPGQSSNKLQPSQSPKQLQPGQSSNQLQPGQSSQHPQPDPSSQQPHPGQSCQQPQPGTSSPALQFDSSSYELKFQPSAHIPESELSSDDCWYPHRSSIVARPKRKFCQTRPHRNSLVKLKHDPSSSSDEQEPDLPSDDNWKPSNEIISETDLDSIQGEDEIIDFKRKPHHQKVKRQKVTGHDAAKFDNPPPASHEPSQQGTRPQIENYRKPYRHCIFCGKMASKLSDHIVKKHAGIPRVKNAVELPKKQRIQEFKMKKEGILHVNKLEAKKSRPGYMRERSSKKKDSLPVMCSTCDGFFSRSYIKRHSHKCRKEVETAVHGVCIPVTFLQHDHLKKNEGDFVTEVLTKFRHGKSSQLCQTDPVLAKIGRRLWDKEKKKKNKRAEVRKSVMSDMRRLANLYIHMKDTEATLGKLRSEDGNVGDLFKRSNFRYLEEALDNYTKVEVNTHSSSDNNAIKPGLKLGLYYLLKSASKILKGLSLMEEEEDGDVKAAEIDNFVLVLELNYHTIFGDATYALHQGRQTRLRRPESAPEESDIRKVRDFTVSQIKELTSDELAFTDLHRYTRLRDLVVCRLTLFNARRGGEPSRHMLQDWEDDDTGVVGQGADRRLKPIRQGFGW